MSFIKPEFNGKIENLRDIYYAGGCFWGVEKFFSLIPGVYDVTVGYANGKTQNPTYKEVCVGDTGHAETVHVRYDPDLVTLKTLTGYFFKIIDPTSLNKQGADVGSQYRTGIYFVDNEDIEVIKEIMSEVRKEYDMPVVTELEPLRVYFLAEEYHQNYLEKNPNGYCHISFEKISILK